MLATRTDTVRARIAPELKNSVEQNRDCPRLIPGRAA